MNVIYCVEFINIDGKEESYRVRSIDDAKTLGMSFAKDKTFKIWKEVEEWEHYISWDIATRVEKICQIYINGERDIEEENIFR